MSEQILHVNPDLNLHNTILLELLSLGCFRRQLDERILLAALQKVV